MFKILLADDEPEIVGLVKRRLEANQYEVIVAHDGQACMAKVHSEAPDVILLDLLMPGMDGFDVCRKLKADKKTRKIPVILFTASFARGIEEKVKELNAFDYVVKPFDPTELLEKIARAVHQKPKPVKAH